MIDDLIHQRFLEALTRKTLNKLFEAELLTISDYYDVIKFSVYSLFEHHKDAIVKIFHYLLNTDIYRISSHYFENNKPKIGLEIFNYVRIKKDNVDDGREDLSVNRCIKQQ